MPNIPRYIAKEEPTSTGMPRAPIGLEGEPPMIGIGQALTVMAGSVAGIEKKRKKAAENDEYATALVDWGKGLNDIEEDFLADTDYKTYDKRFTDRTRKLRASTLKKMKTRKASILSSLRA
jgi:hypothetical protein